ncbi:hypothetical protein Q668_05475 [Alcanivorax sp. PN-3]|nr:hypothetical protein Q668_05475 [Alcanivorax sp. PN-3]
MQSFYIEKNPLAGLTGVGTGLVAGRPRGEPIDYPLQIHQALLEQHQIAPLDGVVNVAGDSNTRCPAAERQK